VSYDKRTPLEEAVQDTLDDAYDLQEYVGTSVVVRLWERHGLALVPKVLMNRTHIEEYEAYLDEEVDPNKLV
jgi:hypothetical protein